MILEVYTIGGGEFLIDFFNATALVMKSPAYLGVIHMVVLIGLFINTFKLAALGIGHTETLKWGLSCYLVFMIAVVPKVSVHIEDKANPGLSGRKIDNIPIGLAIPASLGTKLDKVITETFEVSFGLPDDLTYSKSGMLFGNKMIDTLTRTKVVLDNTDFKEDLIEFIRLCVYDQTLLKNLKPGDFKREEDLKTFILNPNKHSNIFHVRQGRSLVSCKEASRSLGRQFPSQTLQTIKKYAKKLNPSASKANEMANINDMGNKTQSLGDYFLKSSKSATQIIEQSMMIDALYSGFDARASLADSNNRYARVKSQLQTRETWKTIGANAPMYATMLKMFIQGILYAVFPLLIIMVMSGMVGSGVFIDYGKAILGLAFIGPMWAIINRFTAGITSLQLSSVTGDIPAITFANIARIQEVNSDIMAFAGYLTASVIPIAFTLAHKGVMAMGQQLGGMMGSATSNVHFITGETVSGNYSAGNVSMRNDSLYNSSKHNINEGNISRDNTSENNTNSNKFDDTTSVKTGYKSFDDGEKVQTFDANGKFLHSQTHLSNTGVDESTAKTNTSAKNEKEEIGQSQTVADNKEKINSADHAKDGSLGLNTGGSGGGGILSSILPGVNMSRSVHTSERTSDSVNHSNSVSQSKGETIEKGEAQTITKQDRLTYDELYRDEVNRRMEKKGGMLTSKELDDVARGINIEDKIPTQQQFASRVIDMAKEEAQRIEKQTKNAPEFAKEVIKESKALKQDTIDVAKATETGFLDVRERINKWAREKDQSEKEGNN